ncbi:MAG: hypothetical protein J6O51_03375 [Bacteroidales bacterium]|nr:hypothetical protein [Bacteroidales bacterium]
MRKRKGKSKAKYGKRKFRSEEALLFSEDRLQLLDTIHEMVRDELQLRGYDYKGGPHHEKPLPDNNKTSPTE